MEAIYAPLICKSCGYRAAVPAQFANRLVACPACRVRVYTGGAGEQFPLVHRSRPGRSRTTAAGRAAASAGADAATAPGSPDAPPEGPVNGGDPAALPADARSAQPAAKAGADGARVAGFRTGHAEDETPARRAITGLAEGGLAISVAVIPLTCFGAMAGTAFTAGLVAGSVVALGLSIAGLTRVLRRPAQYTGKGRAIAGIVVAALATLCNLALLAGHLVTPTRFAPY
ncbi:MAG: hypothetical protein HY719_04110 [Planctomycetes bacterium]|nr:hypothetical protein [Planctomycetota bacterium]